MNATYRKLCEAQCAWYRQHGKYPTDRIRVDRDGIPYVIGDWSWNRKYPHLPEWVDSAMDAEATAVEKEPK